MKKILVFIIMICSIIALSSCKKKVLTKRTMENFLEDFNFDLDTNTGTKNSWENYEAYIKDTKSSANYFKTVSKLNITHDSLCFNTNKKVVIEKISYTIYNRSETESIFIYDVTNDVWKYKIDGKYQYQIEGDTELKKIEIKPQTEYKKEIEYTDFTVGKNSEVLLSFGAISFEQEEKEIIVNNGGLYNLKIEYSAYI